METLKKWAPPRQVTFKYSPPGMQYSNSFIYDRYSTERRPLVTSKDVVKLPQCLKYLDFFLVVFGKIADCRRRLGRTFKIEIVLILPITFLKKRWPLFLLMIKWNNALQLRSIVSGYSGKL